MGIRAFIAGLIWPEGKRDAEGYHRLLGSMEETVRWLSPEFPEAVAAVDRLLNNELVLERGQRRPDWIRGWHPSIELFREELRRGIARRA